MPSLSESEVNGSVIRHLAAECGLELAGVAAAAPSPDFERYRSWVNRGLAGEMRYLTDRRAEVRSNPENLLPGVRSVICAGLVYNGPQPRSTEFADADRAWISRYAWGEDYHDVFRAKLEVLAHKLLQAHSFSYRICVDTAPLLERSWSQRAGLGWIGRNTCLINQNVGSWFFLGEILTTLEIEATDSHAPNRCGTCTRCIAACPTAAIRPTQDGEYELDATRCISYFTIELRAQIPEQTRPSIGHHVFGCDICQDVCPWNNRAAETVESAFDPREFAPPLERLAAIGEGEFREIFRGSPVTRARYRGFLRNVAVAMGNAGMEKFREPLKQLAAASDPLIAEHALWGLRRLDAAV